MHHDIQPPGSQRETRQRSRGQSWLAASALCLAAALLSGWAAAVADPPAIVEELSGKARVMAEDLREYSREQGGRLAEALETYRETASEQAQVTREAALRHWQELDPETREKAEQALGRAEARWQEQARVTGSWFERFKARAGEYWALAKERLIAGYHQVAAFASQALESSG